MKAVSLGSSRQLPQAPLFKDGDSAQILVVRSEDRDGRVRHLIEPGVRKNGSSFGVTLVLYSFSRPVHDKLERGALHTEHSAPTTGDNSCALQAKEFKCSL